MVFGFPKGRLDLVLGLRIEREVFVSNRHRPQLLDLKPLWGYMEKEREVKEEEEKALVENKKRRRRRV